MKKLFLVWCACMAFAFANAQQAPTDLDKSPLDVSYLPANYPILKLRGQVNGEPHVRILYSRPQKKGRNIFGEEVKYNNVWRLGANEATEIEFFKNATVGGKKIPKGRYSMYCIPSENKWTLIFNKDNFSWGSFNYKPEKDQVRVDVPVQKNNEEIEALTMYFTNDNRASQLVIMWDNVKVSVPVVM